MFARQTFLRLPSELVDELLPDLNEAELKVFLYVTRRTAGFGKELDAISLSQFQHGLIASDGRVLDRGTGLGRKAVIRALGSLLERGILVCERDPEPHRSHTATSYGLGTPESVASLKEVPSVPIEPAADLAETESVLASVPIEPAASIPIEPGLVSQRHPQYIDKQEIERKIDPVPSRDYPGLRNISNPGRDREGNPEHETHPRARARPPAAPIPLWWRQFLDASEFEFGKREWGEVIQRLVPRAKRGELVILSALAELAHAPPGRWRGGALQDGLERILGHPVRIEVIPHSAWETALDRNGKDNGKTESGDIPGSEPLARPTATARAPGIPP